jgi:tubulin monoglycylase TTLL3/8
MWCLNDFKTFLSEEYGYDAWEAEIHEKIKNVVINSLQSVQDMFEIKKGRPFEMFGYDIMIDDDLNCWLIEVNSSPAMDYSTPVTERLVKLCLEDTIKVVVDY